MNRKLLFAVWVMLMGFVGQAWAVDFTVNNADGFPIKYRIKNGNNVVASKADNATYTGTLVIPATVTCNETTYTVAEVYGFTNCGMTQVVLPSTISYVGGWSGCTNLVSINIPSSVTRISHSAFAGCSSLASIDIPSTVNKIEHNAFTGCTSLTAVVIPNSVTSVDTAVFSGCTGLTSAVVGDGVTNLIDRFFRDCTSLTTVTLGSGLLKIDNSAFYGCSSLTAITIPEGVTTIGWQSFYNCTGLASITLPQSLTTIGGYTFYGCTGLTAITIPDNTNMQGTSVFSNCTGLSTVILGNGVTSIPSYAFSGCSSLTAVTIPASITAINDGAFDGCSNLATVNYLGTPVQWLNINISSNNYGVSNPVEISHSISFNGELATHLEIPEGVTSIGANFCNVESLRSVVIPNSVTTLAANAFAGCRLDSLTVGSGLITIGTGAFADDTLTYLSYNCLANILGAFVKSRLTTVVVGNALTSLPNSAFSGCSQLASVTLPASLIGIGSLAFSGCSSLTDITIPATVTSIGNSAFSGCSSLSAINIPNGLTTIEDYTFNGCSSLTAVTIPASVTTIGRSAFNNCTGLTQVNYPGTPAQWLDMSIESSPVLYSRNLYFSGNPLTRLVIPDGVTEVSANFCFDTLLHSLVIGDQVTTLAANAFANCGLDSLIIGSGLNSLGSGAFSNDSVVYLSYNCPASVMGSIAKNRLATVVVGDAVPEIPDNTFQNCSRLTSIAIGSGVTSIGSYAFEHCSSLADITLPATVTSIGSYAFSGCSSLPAITIPGSQTTIESYTFNGCSSLASITIPVGVTEIGSNAFSGCTGLTVVDYQGTPRQWMDMTLTSNPVAFARNLYFNGEPLTRLVIPADVTTVNANFRYDTTLTHVVLGDHVTTLNPFAFADCGLDSLSVGTGLTTIGNNAFSHDTIRYLYYNNTTANILGSILKSGLKSVEIGDQITAIPNAAFQNCTGLVSLTIPEGVDSIGHSAFMGCTSLPSLTIPSSVVFLDYRAFRDCWALTTVVYNAVSCRVLEPGYADEVFSGDTSINSFTFGEGVRVIPAYLCNGMAKLSSVTIPSTVDTIGYKAFDNCTGLTETHYNGTAEDWLGITINNLGSPIYYSRNLYLGNTLLTDLVVPGTVDTVSWNYQYDTALISITIAEGVKGVSPQAFNSCGHFATVRVPNSVTTIGGYAFHNTNIDSLFLGSGLVEFSGHTFGDIKYLNYNSDLSFTYRWQSYDILYGPGDWHTDWVYSRDSLTTVVVGDSVTKIAESSFSYCHNLTTVTISGGVDTIGKTAFSGCIALTNLSIADGVKYIDMSAFSSTAIPSVILPNSLTYIGKNAFGSCENLTSVTVPNSVTSIGQSAFMGCTSLLSATLPDSLDEISIELFKNCSSLRRITIPERVSLIGGSAFWGCSSLTSVTIPDSVYDIGIYAFRECSNLDSLIVGSGLFSMGGDDHQRYVFVRDTISYLSYNCEFNLPAYLNRGKLSTVVIGDNVSAISSEAFKNSVSLASITIPAGISYIGTDAFAGCTAMDSIVFQGDTPPYISCTDTGVVPFNYVSTISVPCGSYGDYFADWQGNSTTRLMYDALNDQYLSWSTVLPNILQETQISYNFQATTADATLGSTLVWYHDNWVASNDYPHSADCADTTVMAKATANYGYHFDHWSNGSNANPLTMHITGDSTVTAFFAPNQYTVTVSSSNNSYGSVSGGGSYAYLTTDTITATAAPHYHFQKWTDGNTDNPRHFVVERDTTFTARFVPDTHHVNAVANNAAYGTVSGSNDYAYGATVTVEATAAEGYYFVHWSDGTTNSRTTFVCHGDTTVTAIFSNVVTPELCMVSVQDDRNVLLWDVEDLPIVSYTLFREGNVSGQYEAIATIPYADAGIFTDTASRPASRSYRYRLSATDTCGNESPRGGVHKTMHLTISQGMGNTWNLVWTAYEGADYTTYVIYRGTSAADIEQIDIMPSDGNTTYSDNNAPAGAVYYQVGVVMSTPCNSGTKSATVSRSNIASNEGGVGIADVVEGDFRIWSNEGHIMVEGADGETVQVFDMTGRLLVSNVVNAQLSTCNSQLLNSGVYLVKVGHYPARKIVVVR